MITGSVGLLGRKHAEAVAAFGAIPVLIDLSQEKVDKLAKELRTQKYRPRIVKPKKGKGSFKRKKR